MIHFAILAFLIVFAMGIYIWTCRKGCTPFATVSFALMAMGAFAINIEATGQPKPIMLEWHDILDAQVVGLTWNEETRQVWIWLMLDGAPHSYVLPWPDDKKKFGDLQDKWRRRGVTGDEFAYDADGEVAKVVPPKPMPEKTQ